MTNKLLSVGTMLVLSLIVGYNLISPIEPVQASPPVIPSYLELSSMLRPKTETAKTDTVNVTYDLSTKEMTVNSTSNAVVNVTTTGEVKPVVKYRTKIVEKEVSTGYPYIKAMNKVPDEELPSILSLIEGQETSCGKKLTLPPH